MQTYGSSINAEVWVCNQCKLRSADGLASPQALSDVDLHRAAHNIVRRWVRNPSGAHRLPACECVGFRPSESTVLRHCSALVRCCHRARATLSCCLTRSLEAEMHTAHAMHHPFVAFMVPQGPQHSSSTHRGSTTASNVKSQSLSVTRQDTTK